LTPDHAVAGEVRELKINRLGEGEIVVVEFVLGVRLSGWVQV
jgi:hypothetical protein